MALIPVFLYGTLRDLDLLEVVLGRATEVRGAHLPDYGVYWVQDRDFPMLAEGSGAEGDSAEGIVVDVDTDEIARLDFYEGPYGYQLRGMDVQSDHGPTRAQVFLPPAGLVPGAPFDLSQWQGRHGPLMRLAAQEIMASFGRETAEDVAGRMPVILARAQAHLNARAAPSPRKLRARMDAQAIEVPEQTQRFSGFFALDEMGLHVPQFDGETSPELRREVFVMCDAVSVLPYDVVRDRVLLIEQFRPGMWRRGDPHPWSLEAIAGRQDAGESAEQTARREAEEEAGLHVTGLVEVGRYYSSPGATTEYLTSYVAPVDLPDSCAGLGGVASEHEDIRVLLASFDQLMIALDSGEVENGPLLISALWLARHRNQLRGG